ncbi:MAG: hypothetical protein ABIQ72_05505 [Usitatibacter sp.]
MNIRNNNDTRRDKWRNRFLEIARRHEVAAQPSQPLGLSGLRSRAKMAGFATVRRARIGACS